MSRSKVTKVEAQPSQLEPLAERGADPAFRPDVSLVAVGLVKTKDGWVAAKFAVNLADAVDVSEPDVRAVGIENFKRQIARIILAEPV